MSTIRDNAPGNRSDEEPGGRRGRLLFLGSSLHPEAQQSAQAGLVGREALEEESPLLRLWGLLDALIGRLINAFTAGLYDHAEPDAEPDIEENR